MTPANVTATLILWKAEILSAAVCNRKILFSLSNRDRHAP